LWATVRYGGDVVAVLDRAHADRLQAAVLADRLDQLLKLTIVLEFALLEFAPWVEAVRDELSRGRRSDES